MSGAGNLFLVIDNSEKNLDFETAQLHVVPLCEKHETEDFTPEGVMYINNSDEYDFEVWFFNPDGSTGMMCGNGGRCAVRFAEKKGFISNKENVNFYMANQIYDASIIDDVVSIFLPPITSNDKIDKPIKGNFIENGTRHYVVNLSEYNNYEEIGDFPLSEIGLEMRHHEKFAPSGTNFNIFQILDTQTIQMRTYERGVEKETGACGTGAIAAAYTAKEFGCIFPLKVIPTSGIPISIAFDSEKEKVILKGHAEIID
jgi:diaminopimelate epimerase